MDTSGFAIKEMIPASNWRAVFRTETGFFTEPVALWCRVIDLADHDHEMVMGYIADGPELQPAAENPLFHSYCQESEVRHYIEDLREGRL